MDTALTAMGCDLDDEAPPSADQVDAAADAASAALSPTPTADKLERNYSEGKWPPENGTYRLERPIDLPSPTQPGKDGGGDE
ncbi:hypothetical protein G6F35_018941 [Rhizopus arrhizus]|nr:hypothetical protein G6F35_018941 [Rhizopus arrhizus]